MKPTSVRAQPNHPDGDNPARTGIERLLVEMRPRLHRYCARMTGSVIDGEDALQDGLARAAQAFDMASIDNPEGWIFRVVHHAALDLLRRRAREPVHVPYEEAPPMEDPDAASDSRIVTAASLRTFMRLPVSQRSCVILKDVLGHSLREIQTITTASIPTIKASLHRGRARLHELGDEPADAPMLHPHEHALLAAYVDRFNARDFDAVRDMLAEEIRLEVVSRATLHGKAEVVRTYFGNYRPTTDWFFVPGFVEGHPAVLACDPAQPSARPRYFILLEWVNGQLAAARDFRHAAYAIDGAEIVRIGSTPL